MTSATLPESATRPAPTPVHPLRLVLTALVIAVLLAVSFTVGRATSSSSSIPGQTAVRSTQGLTPVRPDSIDHAHDKVAAPGPTGCHVPGIPC